MNPHAMDPLDPRTLRSVFGRFATGVAVVTATAPDRRPVGMTVNSFTSVSLDPPMVLFCVSRSSCLSPVFQAADAFAVNILRDDQMAVSWRFASPGFDRFDTLEPRFNKTGAPLLPAVLATIECVTQQVIEAGDHDIVIGEVAALEVSSSRTSDPLLYYGGNYRSLNTEPEWWSVILE